MSWGYFCPSLLLLKKKTSLDVVVYKAPKDQISENKAKEKTDSTACHV